MASSLCTRCNKPGALPPRHVCKSCLTDLVTRRRCEMVAEEKNLMFRPDYLISLNPHVTQWWQCSQSHAFRASLEMICQGVKCPMCPVENVRSLEEHLARASFSCRQIKEAYRKDLRKGPFASVIVGEPDEELQKELDSFAQETTEVHRKLAQLQQKVCEIKEKAHQAPKIAKRKRSIPAEA